MTEIDVEKLSRWYANLNGWEWPDDLPNKPTGFDDLPLYSNKNDVLTKEVLTSAAFEVLRDILGESGRLRAWHIYSLGETEEEFNAWYERTRQTKSERVYTDLLPNEEKDEK